MQYLLLIYHKESEWETLTEAERQQLYGGYRSLREELMNTGHWIGGNQLQPVSTASTVRIRDKKPLISDGPFAETKEQLAGYFLIEAPNLDEALNIAGRIPSAASGGSIEVRPVVMRTVEAGVR
jgi:hypothetical protein